RSSLAGSPSEGRARRCNRCARRPGSPAPAPARPRPDGRRTPPRALLSRPRRSPSPWRPFALAYGGAGELSRLAVPAAGGRGGDLLERNLRGAVEAQEAVHLLVGVGQLRVAESGQELEAAHGGEEVREARTEVGRALHRRIAPARLSDVARRHGPLGGD